MRNPLSSHLNDSILIIGCETFGVLSSALVLTGDEIANGARRELEKRLSPLKKISNFVAVFSCVPLKYTVGKVNLMKFYNLEDIKKESESE